MSTGAADPCIMQCVTNLPSCTADALRHSHDANSGPAQAAPSPTSQQAIQHPDSQLGPNGAPDGDPAGDGGRDFEQAAKLDQLSGAIKRRDAPQPGSVEVGTLIDVGIQAHQHYALATGDPAGDGGRDCEQAAMLGQLPGTIKHRDAQQPSSTNARCLAPRSGCCLPSLGIPP